MLERFCHTLDVELTELLAKMNLTLESEFGDFVETLKTKVALDNQVEEYERQLDILQEEINWMVISNPSDEHRIINQYDGSINDLNRKINEKHQEIEDFVMNNKMPENIGVCSSSLDITLNKLGVAGQVYHGKSFIGYHGDKMLKV